MAARTKYGKSIEMEISLFLFGCPAQDIHDHSLAKSLSRLLYRFEKQNGVCRDVLRHGPWE